MTTYAEYKNALYADRKLTGTQKAVASCIAHHADWKTGQHSHPGNKLIAEETGFSEKSVKRSIPELIDLGWLVQTYNGRGRNSTKASEYALNLPDTMSLCYDIQGDTVSVQRDTEVSSKGHSVPTSTSELPLNDLLSRKEASSGKKRRRTPVSSTPAPRASSATARSAQYGQDAYPSSAPESGRTYVYWESRDVTGTWFVFSVDKALRAPKSAAHVTLSFEEDDFYREFFRGGKEINRSRADFLTGSPEERAKNIEYIRDHREELGLHPMTDEEYAQAA